MELYGPKLDEIDCVIELCRMQRRNSIPLFLKLTKIDDQIIKELELKYKAKELQVFEFLNYVYGEIPIRNLKRILRKDYVKNYDWPREVEVHSLD